MKTIITKLFSARMLALMVAVCATSSAWAEVRPAAAWFGDFSSTTHSNRSVTYTLSNISDGEAASNNTIQGDAENGYYVQMNGSNGLKVTSNATTFGLTSSSGGLGFTALMLYSDYAASSDATTRDLLIAFHDNGATPSKEQIGVANYQNKAHGIWANYYYTTTTATKSPTDATVFPTSATANKTAVGFQFLRGKTNGAFYVKQSDGTSASGAFGGLTSDINISGVSFGGPNFPADANKPLSMAAGIKIHGIVMFHSILSSDELAAWSLTGMTTMQKLTSSQTLTSVGSSTALNLEANGGNFTVASDITAAAVFVQDYAQTITFTSGKINAPFYAGSAVTLDASGYDVSSMKDGDTVQLINGPVCGIEAADIIVPESTSSFVYYATKSSDGIYLNASTNYDWKSVNINFYHDDTSKITTSTAIGLESVAGTSWNNVQGIVGSYTGISVIDDESHSFIDNQIVVSISNIQGSYQDTKYASNSDLRRGFIHDHNTSYKTPTVTISNVPFDAYRVIVYHSTDSNDTTDYAHFGYDTVNGINLTYGTGKLGIGDTQWGDTNDGTRSQPIAEGVNALVSGVYTNKTLTIVSHRMEGNTTRAGIAAIQIIKDSVPTDDVAVSITKPSSDWDSLTLPTIAKLYGICAASSSANEESFGNNSTYLQTLGGRDATVVVVTNGIYTGVNGLIKKTETYSGGTRDTYLIIDGGAVSVVKGRQTKGWGTGTGDTTGNSLTQIGVNAVVGYVYGAGEEGGNTPVLTGSSGVTVKNGAVVTGSIIGGWSSSHQATPRVTQNTSVRVEGLQSVNTAPARAMLPNNYIVGGSVHQTNYASGSKVDGNSSVVIDLPAEASGTFSKCIVGGSLCAHSTDDGGSQNIGGNTSVAITANENVTFNQLIVGGTCSFHSNSDYASTVTGNSSVILNGAVFDGNRIVAGGYATTAGMSTVAKNATLTVNSGTTFNGATLDGGNANQTKKLVANTAIDTSTVTVTGFNALDIGAGVTQAAITQASGEFAEIMVHDGAQYTAATTGTSNLRVVSSTDGGTKGVVVFDGLASTYTGNITIASGAKAKLVSGTYTGTFTVESGATLEIDPGAAYSCAASFTGAGNVVVKSGTVTFTGANTLPNGITIEDDAIVVVAVSGDEGHFNVASGGTLRLYVTTDQYQHEGNVFKGTNNGTVEYYHGTEADYSDYVKITDSNSLNGNNLLPYYQIWKVVGDATEGNINTAANWPGASAVPTVREDETYGNVAFYVASGTVTVNIDATMNFSEIQVYGSGTIVFKSDGNHYLSANYLSMTSGVNVQISGGEALKLSNGEIMATQASQMIAINSGAKLSLDGVSCANKIICNGTLETAGTTTLSGSNEIDAGGTMDVVTGKTTMSFRQQYFGGMYNYAYVTINNGAELEFSSEDPIYYNGYAVVKVKGTLTLESGKSIKLGSNTPIYIYPGGEIGGDGTINVGGNGSRPDSTIKMFADGGDDSASATISSAIEINSYSGSAKIIVEDGVTLVCSGSVTAASGKSLTKQGTGTLDLTAITPSVPMTIDVGKVVADEVPTATITINENGTFTLKDKAWAKGDTDCFSGSGTLELYAATTKCEHDVEGVSFNGIVKVTNASSMQNNFKGTAAMFSSAPEFVLNATDTYFGGGYYDNDSEHPFEVKNLSGSGTFKAQWTQANHSYVVKTTQAKDTVFSGEFSSSTSGGNRVMNLTVVGDGSGTVNSLALSAGQNASSSDTAQAASTLNISSDAKVVFTSSGGWGYGSVIVGNGGWLQSTNETAVKKLTLQSGSHLVMPTKTSQLTGITTISATGTIKVHIADDTEPESGDYLVDWTAAGLENAPSGNFLLLGSAAEDLALQADTTGLKVVAVVCTLTANGETVGYTSLNDALAALYMARNADKDAYITIKDGSTPSDETIATWAAGNIGWDSENSKFYIIVVAQIGAVKYLSLADAISAAESSGDTITLKTACSENVNLGSKSVTFNEDSGTFTGSFTGSGTLIMTALPKALASARWAAGWTGTLWLQNCSLAVKDRYDPIDFGNATSTLRLTGCTGGFNSEWNSSGSIAACTLNLQDDGETKAFTITKGFPGYGFTSFAKLTGSGTLVSSDTSATAPNAAQCYRFGDASEFAGSIEIGASSTLRVVIGGENSSDTGNANPSFISDYRKIVVKSGASATIASGKTWTAPGGVTVDGSLSVANTGTLTGTIAGGGTITYAALPSAPTFGSWTGTVVLPADQEFDGQKLDDYGIKGSTVRLQGANTGWFHYKGSNGQMVATTIEIPSGASLTVTEFSPSFANGFDKLIGAGTFAVNIAGNIDRSYSTYSAYFQLKDISGFAGSLSATGAGIAISDDRIANSETGGKIIVAKDATVHAGATWTATDNIKMTGSATLTYNPGAGNTYTMSNAQVKTATKGNTIAVNTGTVICDATTEGIKTVAFHVLNGGHLQIGTNTSSDNDMLGWSAKGDVGAVTVDKGGILTFKSRETYTRNTTLNGGTIYLSSTQGSRGIDIHGGQTITVTDDSLIEATGSGSYIYLRQPNAVFDVAAGKVLRINASFTYNSNSANDFNKRGAGTVVVNGYSGDSSFSQPKGVVIDAGTYELNAVQNSNGQTGDAANFYTVASGAKLKVGATGQANMTTLTLNDGSLLEFGAGNATLINTTTTSHTIDNRVQISFSDGVTPTTGTTLISWTEKPAGVFAFANSELATDWQLIKGNDGLKIMAIAKIETDTGSDEVGYVDPSSNAAIITNAIENVTIPSTVDALATVLTGNSVSYAYSGSNITALNNTIYVFGSDVNGQIQMNYDLTACCTVTVADGKISVALDGTKYVNSVKVQPEVAASEPMTLTGDAPVFKIKTIPGLWYSVQSGTNPSTLSAGTPMQATGATTTLNQATELGDEETVRYYKIAVGASKAALE